MKNINKLFFFVLTAFLIACSEETSNGIDFTGDFVSCDSSEFILELSDDIPAKVMVVEDGEPFFNGIRTYYLTDAETYIPELFEQTNTKFVRIFSTRTILNIGNNVFITGNLNWCHNPDHGLLSNDIIGLYFLETKNTL